MRTCEIIKNAALLKPGQQMEKCGITAYLECFGRTRWRYRGQCVYEICLRLLPESGSI